MTDRLILCLDGTWNSTFKAVEREDRTTVLKPTNPLKLARAVLPVDPAGGGRQVTRYDSGVGALGLYPGTANRLLNFFDSRLGGAFGAGFEANVERAATFIAHNHTRGAEIFVFGFSRGAAQARALTNFLDWLGGIPERSDAYYIPIFFRHYMKHRGGGDPADIRDGDGHAPSERVRRVDVAFLGVWDTVMALGSRLRASRNTSVAEKSFYVRTTPAGCVRHARQALALDEKRYDFRPEIWQDCAPHQTLEQRWFPGAHGNVGGSYGNDGLANCALQWIAGEAKTRSLALDEGFLGKYRGFSQDRLADTHSLPYRLGEAARFKLGRGARSLSGHPETARLSLDPSVIRRLCSDPAEFERMDAPYRPPEVVALAARHRDDPEAFLRSYGLDPATNRFPDDIRGA